MYFIDIHRQIPWTSYEYYVAVLIKSSSNFHSIFEEIILYEQTKENSFIYNENQYVHNKEFISCTEALTVLDEVKESRSVESMIKIYNKNFYLY